MDIAGIAVNTLWKLEDEYVVPVDKKHKFMVYYKSHEHWYTEVENPIELQKKKN
jgi:hypothetical protein